MVILWTSNLAGGATARHHSRDEGLVQIFGRDRERDDVCIVDIGAFRTPL
jgi:hypothetical protein